MILSAPVLYKGEHVDGRKLTKANRSSKTVKIFTNMWATIIWLFCLRTWPVQAIVSSGRPGHGLVGYGISMDKPTCAYACKDAITNPLQCGSGTSGTSGTSVLTQSTDEPPPECYADNEPFLQTLAYCLSFYCVEVPVWRLEKFWELNVAGRRAHQPRPEQSYQETLVRMEAPPNSSTPPHDTLTHASLIDEGAYVGLYNAEYAFSESEDAHERYGLVRAMVTNVFSPNFNVSAAWC